MTPFQEKIAYLDAALTGKDWRAVSHSALYQNANPDVLYCGAMYYLSDGGYSRVYFDDSSGRLLLASESRNEVKASWINCRELISDVESAVREWIAQQSA
jgi:hypothetical protein